MRWSFWLDIFPVFQLFAVPQPAFDPPFLLLFFTNALQVEQPGLLHLPSLQLLHDLHWLILRFSSSSELHALHILSHCSRSSAFSRSVLENLSSASASLSRSIEPAAPAQFLHACPICLSELNSAAMRS